MFMPQLDMRTFVLICGLSLFKPQKSGTARPAKFVYIQTGGV